MTQIDILQAHNMKKKCAENVLVQFEVKHCAYTREFSKMFIVFIWHGVFEFLKSSFGSLGPRGP